MEGISPVEPARPELKPLVEPYDHKITLDFTKWMIIVNNLRGFLHNMQMNIRDIDSGNYEDMKECEVDTKVHLP